MASKAVDLANEHARKEFNSQPFKESQGTLRFVKGKWEWEAMAGYGTGDLKADVSMSPKTKRVNVSVTPLINEQDSF